MRINQKEKVGDYPKEVAHVIDLVSNLFEEEYNDAGEIHTEADKLRESTELVFSENREAGLHSLKLRVNLIPLPLKF